MRFSLWRVILVLLVFMVGCNGASGPELLNQGVIALNQKKYTDAVTLLTKATDKLPKSAEAYNYLGAAYQGKGDQTLAVKAFEKSIALDANYPPPRFNLGVVFLERQEHSKAVEHLTRFVALQPNNIEGFFYLASAQFQLGDLPNARLNYLEVVKGDPNRPEVLNNLGVISARLAQPPREAETWFNACIKTDAKYSPAYLNLAILYHHTMNKPMAALDYYERFLELEPAGPSSKTAKESIEQLRKTSTVAMKPKDQPAAKPVEPLPVLAELAKDKPVPPKAEEPPAPAAAPVVPPEPPKPAPAPPVVAPAPVAPSAPPVTAITGPGSLPGPRWPAKSIEKFAPGKRDAALAEFNRGAQAQKERKLDQAVYSYKEAIKLDPTLTSAYYNLGTAFQAQRLPNQAIEMYQIALSQQPGMFNARLNLGMLYEAQGYLSDAAEQFDAIVRSAPDNATAHLLLGRIYARFEPARSLARQHYQRYLELAPNSVDARRVERWLQQNK
jgi:tetratricopeptide (TPR) repeat protein